MSASTAIRPRRTLPQQFLALALLLCLSVFFFHGTALAAATASASLTVPTTVQIGANFSFTVTFDNVGSSPGYGPFVDLIFPVNGADGAAGTNPPLDGIDFVGATYLGQPVVATQLTFPAGTGCVAHPYAVDNTGAPIQVCGTPGDKLVVLQLPFGSFTPNQPPAVITVNARMSNLADANTPLTIQARSGFQFGNDPLNNPTTDPSVLGSFNNASTTPTLLTLKKTYIGPEDETATGPNFPRQYRIDVSVAPGQTITNLDLTDVLPNNLQFVSLDAATGNTTTLVTAISTPNTTTPGGTLTRRLNTVLGTGGTSDASMLFTFYVPLNNASGAPVINPATGDDATSVDDARAQGTWTPIDPRDPPTVVTSDVTTNDHTLTDKSIAIQKGVTLVNDVGAVGYSVGDTLEYTLNFQISDFFAFQNVVIDDTLSDGQHYTPGFAPQLSINGNGFALPAAPINPANMTIADHWTGAPSPVAPIDGTTLLQFRVSNELLTRGRPNGRLIGGCVPSAGTGGPVPNCGPGGAGAYNDGATTATITFRTVILDRFTDNFPSGDPYVDSGDHLDNDVTIAGDLLSIANTNNPTGFSEADTSGTVVNIVFGALSKSVYAINGSTAFATPVRVAPGDTVTYRIEYSLASSDFENLQFIDNLPLPIFSSTQVVGPFSTAGGIPVAGQATYGPADTYHLRPGAVVPAITSNGPENSLTFSYGTYNDPGNQASAIDMLFTVTVNNQPFADRLFLTNQVHETDGSTNGPNHIADAIVQIQLTEPTLSIRKGAVASDNPAAVFAPAPLPGGVTISPPGGACPRLTGTVHSGNLGSAFDSNVSNLDAGDRVTFAIVVENTGSGLNGAFDVRIRDTLPAGFVVPGTGINMCVTDGTGAPFSITDLGGGLLGSGIELNDPGPTPAPSSALDPGQTSAGTTITTGRNIAIITYDLVVDTTVQPRQQITNTATLFNYANTEGGPDFTAVDTIDIATATIASPSTAKTLIGSEVVNANNSSSQVVIGELVTYQLVVTVPEGVTPNARIVDTLDPGLAFVDVVSVTTSAGVSTSTPIGTGAAPANVAVGAGGSPITFQPGTITNANSNNAVADTMTIVYRAVVLDIAGNQDVPATLLKNSAVFSWTGNTLAAVQAAPVTVIEPVLSLNKTATPTTGDAGDTITFDLTVQNTAAGTTDAYDLTLSDIVPAGMTYVVGSLTNVSGPAATLDASGAPTLLATWATFPKASTSVVRFQATLNSSVTPNQAITNNANVKWTSLPGAPGQRSTYNNGSTERTGAGGVDNYSANGAATVTVTNLALAKSIVATSEAHTSCTGGPPCVDRVAIGEIVRYHLAVQLPEGTAGPDFQLRDNLPAGLQFLNDGTARVAFVANGGGISSAAAGAIPAITPALPSCAGLNITGASAAVTPTCPLPDLNVSSSATTNNDTYASSTDPFFKLGSLTNSDSDGDAEYVVVEFNAVVANIAGNTSGTTRNNNFLVTINSSQVGPTSADVGVRIAEPSITNTTKTATPTTGDAGDTIAYRVTYSNATGVNAATAFDVRIVDTLPAALTLNVGSVTVTSACATGLTNASAGNTIDVTFAVVPAGCSVQIDYTASIRTSVTPGQVIPNTANLTYTSLPGLTGTSGNPTGSNTPGASGSATGERNGSGGVNTYAGSSSAQVTVFVPAPVKTLVTTSEGHTSGSNLAVGEIARYHLAVRLAEGTSPNFQLRDNLPAGMRFLNDGSATVAFVANDGGVASSNPAFAGASVIGNASSVTPSFAIPGATISGGTGGGGAFVDGDDPIFSLGSLTNNDSDIDQEFVVIEFNALVDNIATNQGGTTLDNTFDVFVNGSSIATSAPVSATVVEPVITNLTKTVTTTPTDAGDTVVYQLTYSNSATGTSRADAFDVALIDTLDSNLALQSVSVTVPAGSTASDTSSLGVGGTVRVTIDRLPPAVDIPGVVKTVTIVVTARVINSAPNGQIIPNVASLTYSSLPGASGTAGNPTGSNTPGSSGSATGERNGSGGVNDYSNTSNTVNVTLATPTIVKLAPNPTNYTIGDTITYNIRVTLPEGATQNLKVIDTLPVGLSYVSSSMITTAAASGGLLTADYNGTLAVPAFTNVAGVLTFDFGTTQTNGSGPANGTSNNQFLVRVLARVGNIIGNQQGTTLVNSANLTFTNPNVGTTTNVPGGSQTVTVVEPVLTLNKSILTPASPADAGGSVTYRIVIGNPAGPNTSTAYDTRFRDTLPTALLLNPPSVTVTASGGASGIVNNSAVNTVDVTIGSIPVGGSVTIDYSATIATSVAPGQTINNTGDVIWSSLPGADPNERRDGNGMQGGGGLNDYELQSGATFVTVNNPTIAKALAATSDPLTNGGNVTIGEVLTYSLTVTLPEGTIPSLQVVDNLPPGLAYVTGSATVNTSSFGGSVPAQTVTSAGGSGDDVTISFGSITVNGDNNTSNNSFVITLQARVLNIPSNVGVNPPGQTSLPNSSTLQIGGGPLVPSNTVPATVVEPQITTTKSVSPNSGVQAGDILTYVVRFTNNGTSTAYDVTARDTLAPGTAFVAVSGCVDESSTSRPPTVTNSGTTVDFDGTPPGSWDIPVNGFIECTYTVAAQNGIFLDGSHTNTIDADWSSLNGAASGERVYDDSTVYPVDGTQDTATATFTTGTPNFVKDNGDVSEAVIGQVLTYTLTIDSPLGTLRNLQITDTLPAGLFYNSGSSTINGIGATPSPVVSAPNDGSAPVTLTWNFGDVVITSNPAVIIYTATVADVSSNQSGVTLTNDAALTYNNAANTPQPPLPSSAEFTVVEPTLAIDKRVSPLSAIAGDLVTFSMLVTNTSDVPAYDVVVADTVPSSLTYVPGSIRIVSGPAGVTNDTGVPNLLWTFPVIGSGEVAVVEFDARINSSGVPSTPIVNTAGVTWTSTPGTNPNERTGADGPGGALDDYAATSQATLLTSAYEISKSLIDPPGGLVGVNDTVSFSITITNTGATTLATVPLTDSFDPAFLQFLTASTAPDTVGASQLTWNNVGPLAPGAIETITVNFKALAATLAQPGGVTINRTGVTGATDQNNTTLAPMNSSAPVAIGAPDLRIAKTDGQITTTPGSTLTYTIQVTNTGFYTATNVVITETLPLNTSFVGGSVTWTAQGGGVYTYALPAPLGSGQSTTVTFVVTVDSTLPAGVNTINNTAIIGDDGTRGPDPTPGNNSSTDVDTMNAAPDLVITKTDGGITTTPGSVVTYTLSYTNTGNQDATGVVISEVVPANSRFNAAGSTAGWSCADGAPAGTSCTFAIGNLAVGASGSVTFAVTVDTLLPAGVTQLSNTATIADDGTNGADPTPGNNSSSDTTPLTAAPDLMITKTDGGVTTTPGGVVIYTLSYSNTGNQDASGVVITEMVPANSRFNAAGSTASWSCANGAPAGTSCTFTVGKLAAGASGSVMFAVTVNTPLPAGVTQLSNTATIADDGTNGADPTPGNNSDSDTTPITAAPDLQLHKSDGGITMLSGAPITYTLTYTNVGVIAATGVVITETVPAYTSFNAAASLPTVWSCANGAPAGTTCVTTIAGAVAGGSSGSVRFVVIVDNPLPSSVMAIDNTAVIGDDGTNGSDPTPADNTSSVTTPFNPTAITLVSFTAAPHDDMIVVRWTTSAEFNTWGFYLYRSTNGTREHAVRVTPQLILGQGRDQGASYTWKDRDTVAGTTYAYWLQEVELSGTVNEYGPASAVRGTTAAPYQVFIPFVGH